MQHPSGKHRTNLPLAFMALLLVTLAPGFSTATEKREIVWSRFDAPPLYILSGPLKGKGFGDKLLDRLPSILTGYSHSTSESNLARTMTLMQTGGNICCASLIRSPKRERVVAFSKAAGWVLPNRLLVLTRNASLFDPWITGEGLDLNGLIADGRVTIGAINERAYGEKIDHLLDSGVRLPYLEYYLEWVDPSAGERLRQKAGKSR